MLKVRIVVLVEPETAVNRQLNVMLPASDVLNDLRHVCDRLIAPCSKVVQTLCSSFGICFDRSILAAANGTVSRIRVVDPKCVTERDQIEEHSESYEYQRVSVGQAKRS
jgi:hypothetical protein